MTAQSSSATPASDHDMPLELRLAVIEAQIRAQPAALELRWALFQLLCVMGQWERALRQLQVYVQLSPREGRAAQAYRGLIRAERWRAKVIAGRERPGFVFDAPSWVDGLIDALRLAGAGQSDAADRAREVALDNAPLTAGRSAQTRFGWIGDSDSRFGPVCEVVTAGYYRWLPFSDIAAWKVERPSSLLDLVWAPCTLTLADGSAVRGFMPARYPGSEGVPGGSVDSDAIRLGRTTSWQETGHTGVIASGQKTWTTSVGDMSLFDLTICEFGNGMTNREPAQHGGTDEPA